MANFSSNAAVTEQRIEPIWKNRFTLGVSLRLCQRDCSISVYADVKLLILFDKFDRSGKVFGRFSSQMPPTPLRPEFFRRIDDSNDELFYLAPRFVVHIDDGAIKTVEKIYLD